MRSSSLPVSLCAAALLTLACGPTPSTTAPASSEPATEPADPPAAFTVSSSAYADGAPIPTDYAFCVPSEETVVTMGSNKNPGISWENAPEATKSFVVLMHDPDVPSVMDNVNKEGATLAKAGARTAPSRQGLTASALKARGDEAPTRKRGLFLWGSSQPVSISLDEGDAEGGYDGYLEALEERSLVEKEATALERLRKKASSEGRLAQLIKSQNRAADQIQILDHPWKRRPSAQQVAGAPMM